MRAKTVAVAIDGGRRTLKLTDGKSSNSLKFLNCLNYETGESIKSERFK